MRKEVIKAVIGPSQPEQEEMVKAVVTPAHANALKALLNQPFTGTFNHPRAQGKSYSFKVLIASMPMMPLEVGLYL